MSNSSHPSLATCTFIMTREIVVALFSKTNFFSQLIVFIVLALVLYDEAGRAVTIDEKIFPKIKVQYTHTFTVPIYLQVKSSDNSPLINHVMNMSLKMYIYTKMRYILNLVLVFYLG